MSKDSDGIVRANFRVPNRTDILKIHLIGFSGGDKDSSFWSPQEYNIMRWLFHHFSYSVQYIDEELFN